MNRAEIPPGVSPEKGHHIMNKLLLTKIILLSLLWLNHLNVKYRETGIYDDNGNGLCGTVVYHVRVSDSYSERSYDESTHTFVLPKGDPVLRTDINSCFMAYRYHFKKGDYNKQTGIANVVDKPLESLSVNLPLGSTVKSDAYKNYSYIDSDNVFIERAEDLSLSYTDYYWNY